MKILFAEDERGLLEIVSLVLKTKLNAEVLTAVTGKEAIEIIKRNPDLACVLCDYNMPQGSGGDVFRYLRSIESKIPFILCSSDPPEYHPEFAGGGLAGSVVKPFDMKQIMKALSPFVQPPGKETAAANGDEFVQVSTGILATMNTAGCDLYIRLSEQKHVKYTIQGDSFAQEDRKRLLAKNIDSLYVKRADADRLMDKFADELLTMAMTKAPAGKEQVFRFSELALEFVAEILQQFHVSKKVEKMIQASVELTLSTIQKDRKLTELFTELFVDQNHYVSSHSIVLSHVVCSIAHMVGKDDEATLQKLIFASFLHDITLKNAALAQYQRLDESTMRGHGFSKDEIAQFARHPHEAAALSRKFSAIPQGVDIILTQHHERPDGSGFPRQLKSDELDPLSAIFIAGHELMTYLHESGNKADVKGFLKTGGPKLDQGQFKKIIAVMIASSNNGK